MTKEELLKQIKNIDASYSQEERIKVLEALSTMLKNANQELKDAYASATAEMKKTSP